MISFFNLCSPASDVTAGFDVEAPEDFSAAEETHVAGPGSGLSLPVLYMIAQIIRLWAASVDSSTRRKLSQSSENSFADNSPEAIS